MALPESLEYTEDLLPPPIAITGYVGSKELQESECWRSIRGKHTANVENKENKENKENTTYALYIF